MNISDNHSVISDMLLTLSLRTKKQIITLKCIIIYISKIHVYSNNNKLIKKVEVQRILNAQVL